MAEFTLDDFKRLLFRQTSLPGRLKRIMKRIPGMGVLSAMIKDDEADRDIRRLGGVIDSMTAGERRNPRGVIDTSRRRRIAAGAGVEPHEVNEVVKQFEPMADMMNDMMKKMSTMGKRGYGF